MKFYFFGGSDFDLGICNQSWTKCSDSRFILKVVQVCFTNRMNGKCKGKRYSKDNTEAFGLSNWKNGISIN
jgi:hypothetical protein